MLLQGELHETLVRLNPQIPAAVLDEVTHQLGKPDHPSLIQSNRAFHEAMVGGVPVEAEINGERKGGLQRKRGSEVRRRGDEEDRGGGYREIAKQHHGRLAKARARSCPLTQPGSHHATPLKVPV